MTSSYGYIAVPTDNLSNDTISKLRSAIDSILAEASSPVEGWTVSTAIEAIRRLQRRNRPAQLRVLRAIAENGGYVDRAQVYELAGYGEQRRLNGFSKPVNGVVRELVDEGALPSEAGHPMYTDYDADNPSFQKARGFGMPTELAPVFTAAFAELA